MKKNTVLSMLFAGMFLAASAGFALADMEEMPVNDRFPGSQDTSIYAPGSWQYEGPVDTGKLPPSDDLSNAQSGADDFPQHESGGILFREGVDTE
ncbi:MAG: hypothetical protein HZB63_01880 [Deltaproteobacteria bacterium]|nr:hypothetical protein [Deltaproteobacteria bacterium]